MSGTSITAYEVHDFERYNEAMHRRSKKNRKTAKGFKLIIGWAEPCHGGWVAMARDEGGYVHRAACMRECQMEALNVAHHMTRQMRGRLARALNLSQEALAVVNVDDPAVVGAA